MKFTVFLPESIIIQMFNTIGDKMSDICFQDNVYRDKVKFNSSVLTCCKGLTLLQTVLTCPTSEEVYATANF